MSSLPSQRAAAYAALFFRTPIVIDPSLLFEFAIEVAEWKERSAAGKRKPSTKSSSHNDPMRWQPTPANLLPRFETLSNRVSHSQVSMAWSTAGLYFQASTTGKKTVPRFVQERGGFSDGLRVWVDTRCSPGIHRATRFCHCFHFFPGAPSATSSSSDGSLRPRGILDEIPRARELPSPIDSKDIQVQSEFHRDGYTLWAHIPTSCLTGYSPLEFDRIRVFYDVVDSELGTQSMALGPELRYAEDPSHWVQASLVSSMASSLR